jgi:phosphohistidine phosphatase
MASAPSLYLVRHAIAAERGDDWPDDDERPLTHAGVARMRRAVEGLRELDVRVDVVLTSPLVRAVETAEVLVAGLKPAPTLQVMPLLAPGGAPAKIADAVAAVDAERGVALVGHEPGLGELAAWLIGARSPLQFKKGGVCRIDVGGTPAARAGQLVWFATPKMLRALGKT